MGALSAENYVTLGIRMLRLSRASNDDAEVADCLVQAQCPTIDAMELPH